MQDGEHYSYCSDDYFSYTGFVILESNMSDAHLCHHTWVDKVISPDIAVYLGCNYGECMHLTCMYI